MADHTKCGECPFCGGPVDVEIQDDYTVRAGQACDWEPGYVNVAPACECRDVFETLGGDIERYDETVTKTANDEDLHA